MEVTQTSGTNGPFALAAFAGEGGHGRLLSPKSGRTGSRQRGKQVLVRSVHKKRLQSVPSTREAILDAASEQFAVHSFHGVKISRLCEAIGIANGTFYIYFQSKRDLYESVLNQSTSVFMSALKAREDETLPPALADLRDVEFIVDFALNNRWLALAVFKERALKVDGSMTILDRLIEQRSAGIEAGQRRGVFRKDISPRLGARAEVAVTTDLIGSWLQERSRMSREELISALWQFRLRLNYEPAHWKAAAEIPAAGRKRQPTRKTKPPVR